MRKNRSAVWLALAAVPAALVLGGCAERTHQRYRVLDPVHGDYHNWDEREALRYDTWERESGRTHRTFDRLGEDEQNEYWDWRHSR